MAFDEWSIEDEIKDTRMKQPHVVLLGAGASVAALPHGDKYGRKLPVMDNFVQTLNLEPILDEFNIKFQGTNFERLYADLLKDPDLSEAVTKIENNIRDYFSSLELPDHPTIYDHLVLSLREKDLIATFNWDPFLFQACQRNYKFAKLPSTIFLHGCVSVGVDPIHKIKGPVGGISSKGQKFEPARILYPIEQKDYNSDLYIKAEWDTLSKYLKYAYIFTVFGYGAPSSDVEAIQLLKDAWGNSEEREFEEAEIIDVKPEEELANRWDHFIHSHHYQVHDDFYKSIIGNHPRRSCDFFWNQTMECKFIDDYPLPKDASFEDLYKWLEPYIREE